MVKSIISIAALAGLAAAQQLDLAAISAAPLPSVTQAPVGASSQSTLAFDTAAAGTQATQSVEPTQAASSNSKRDGNCAPQPKGSGPTPQPDTPQNFENYPYFTYQADTAPPAPFPYYEVFRNLNGSTQQNSYLTYYVLNSYNVNQCAQYCNNIQGGLCTAFNIYIERDPSVDPGPNCPNPASTTNYKCALYGSSISAKTATNTGQYRDQFEVVIAGSNGYDKTSWTQPQLPPGWSISANISGQAITGASSFSLGAEFFAGPFDPALCSLYATAQTSANKQQAKSQGASTYQPANSFNAYTVYKNGYAWGTYCSIFNTNVGASYAGSANVNSGSDSYTVGSSYIFSLSQQDPGHF